MAPPRSLSSDVLSVAISRCLTHLVAIIGSPTGCKNPTIGRLREVGERDVCAEKEQETTLGNRCGYRRCRSNKPTPQPLNFLKYDAQLHLKTFPQTQFFFSRVQCLQNPRKLQLSQTTRCCRGRSWPHQRSSPARRSATMLWPRCK